MSKKSSQKSLLINCINKIAKLSKQYINLVEIVKKSDYIRGFNTSVSYAQLKELENIHDRLDGNGNSENYSHGEVMKSIKLAVQEIEEVLMNQSDQYSIPEIVDFIKKQFYQVFSNSKSEAEDNLITQTEELTHQIRFNENEVLEGVKEKLDFQNVIKDLTKNYEWIKDKSIKSLSGLEDKYDQISRELSDLNQRVSTFNIHDSFSVKNQRTTSGKLMSQLKDTEKKIILNVLNDILGLIKYTDESVRAKIEFSFEDIESLREAINQYNELLEDKIKTLPGIISQGNLKRGAENKEEVYQILLSDQDKSEKIASDADETLKEEYRKLSKTLSKWRKDHKSLYDEVNSNYKMMKKLHNNKEGGIDSINTLKELYKQSNIKISSLLKEQYSLHYSTSIQKLRSKRDKMKVLGSIQNTKENKAEEKFNIPAEEVESNESLVNRINYLRSEIGELKQFKESSEIKEKELSTLKIKNNELNTELLIIKANADKLQEDLSYSQSVVKDHSNTNKTLSDAISSLKEEKKLLESMLSKNKESQYESLKEFRDILSRTKNACETQILNTEKELKNYLQDLGQEIVEKNKLILNLERKLNEFKSNIMPALEREASSKIANKLNEIQTLNSRNKEMKSKIDEITHDRDLIENKFKQSQNTVKELQLIIKNNEDEILRIRKTAEEQETIANSLYENRLEEKNREIEKLEADLRKKNEQITRDISQLEDSLGMREEQAARDIEKLKTDLKKKDEQASKEIEKLKADQRKKDEQASIEIEKLKADQRKKDEQASIEIEKLKSDQRKKDEQVSKEFEKLKSDLRKKEEQTNIDIDKLKSELRKKEEQAITDSYEKDKAEQSAMKEKVLKEKSEAILEKYRTFSIKVCSHFKYEEPFTHEDEERYSTILDGLFRHLQQQKLREKEQYTKQIEEHAKSEVAKLKQIYEVQSSSKTNQEIEKLLSEVSNKKIEITNLNDTIVQLKQENEILYKEKEDLEGMVGEKNEVITGHMKTLENMKTTILTLRDNLKTAFDDVENKKKEVEKYNKKFVEMEANNVQNLSDQRISLLSTINSHFIATGIVDEKENDFNDSYQPTFESLFEIVVNKIRTIKIPQDKPEVDENTMELISNLENKIKSLTNQLRDSIEALEKKEKDYSVISKQRDTLRAQLQSAVEVMNIKESELCPAKTSDSEMMPSLQSQLQILQDESKTSEMTRDMTEHLIEMFEKNDKKYREKLENAHKRVKKYKEKVQEQRQIIKELKLGSSGAKDTAEYRNTITAEIKKKIREEEIVKRDKEIERQRRLMANKSEEQAIYFNQKIEEFEAKIEAKDNEITDYLIKLQEAEREIEKQKTLGSRKNVQSPFDTLEDLAESPEKQPRRSLGYDKIKLLEKVEKFDERIIQLSEKIDQFRTEFMEMIEKYKETSVEEKPSRSFKDKNEVVQVVRKLETEGYNWLLLERKDPLDKPLELKSSHSLSKSSYEHTPGHRKLFWVCEESMKEEELEYIFSFTPTFLLKSNSMRLSLPEPFQDEKDKAAYRALEDAVIELKEKKNILLKEQREIRLGINKAHFILGNKKYK